MPAKKTHLTDPERAKRIKAMAREIEADQSPKAFEKAFMSVVRSKKADPKKRANA